MTDEQRLQMITEQLILVRDNMFRGMSKSIQKLQARSINEVLELPNHTQSPPAQRKPLLIGKESAEFAKWFNAVWLGDGEQSETIPTSGKKYDDYLSQYTLAFGAWMAAKEAAHSIKENT